MLQNAVYGIKLNGAIPYVTTIIQDSELAEVDLGAAFDVSSPLGKTYPWGIAIDMGSQVATVNGDWEVYVSLFNDNNGWELVIKQTVTAGKLSDDTISLLAYNFANTANIRVRWVPLLGSTGGVAKVKFVINPNFV